MDVPPPTPSDVERIRAIPDPVIRNLQITQCYHELSAALAARLGPAANWCTFATWASRQAGQTIRKEDFQRLLERLLDQSPSTLLASQNVAAAVPLRSRAQLLQSPHTALSADLFNAAVERASDAVARGNKKVFEEIGQVFAAFYQVCLSAPVFDPGQLPGFLAGLLPGDPPGGQGCLRLAFSHYARSMAETDPAVRAQHILLANLQIGFHEQTRLQPEIAESMDAGLASFLKFARPIFRALFPLHGWFHLAHLYLMRLLRRPTALDLAMRALFAELRLLLRQAITETMMTISLPSGVVLRLGEDLPAGFPETLRQVADPELARFLQAHDRSPDGLSGTGAVDWADLPDRLNFIIGLFRCYQEQPALFEPPYTPEQVEMLKAGKVPEGRL